MRHTHEDKHVGTAQTETSQWNRCHDHACVVPIYRSLNVHIYRNIWKSTRGIVVTDPPVGRQPQLVHQVLHTGQREREREKERERARDQ